MFLLDTNAVSDLMRHPRGAVFLRQVSAPAPVVTSIIVAGEIRFGLARRPSTGLAEKVERVLDQLDILPFGGDADRVYGRLRAELERAGRPIGAVDMFIAAHALTLGAVLVTDDADFLRIEGLAVVNWLRD